MKAPPSFLDRLSRLVAGLSGALAVAMAGTDDPSPLFMVWRWLDRLQRRAERLAERLARGESVRPRWAMVPDLFCLDRPPPLLPSFRLPRRRGWLERQGIDTEAFFPLLRALFADPTLYAFLDQAPQLWPAFHQLKRLLGVEWPAADPVRPRRERRRASRSAAAAFEPVQPWSAQPGQSGLPGGVMAISDSGDRGSKPPASAMGEDPGLVVLPRPRPGWSAFAGHDFSGPESIVVGFRLMSPDPTRPLEKAA